MASSLKPEDSPDPVMSPISDETESPPIETVTEEEADSAISSFIENNSKIQVAPSYGRLPLPIVIPQRRPGNKQRGFMRAYAPVLSDFGISREHFHDFIDALNKAVQVSKWIAAIQLAAFGASFVPNQISMGVTAGVQIVSAVAAKAEIRWKVNAFLDQANRELFCPRGLYCLIVTYNPIPLKDQDDFMDKNIEKSATSPSNWPRKVKKNLRDPFSATTQGGQNLPIEVAPLIFPDDEEGDPNTKPKAKTWNRLNDYFDKRARARYAKPKFKNRFLDPNHPATNGGLLGLVSGGHLTRDPKKMMEDTKKMLQQQESLMIEQQDTQLELLRKQFQAMGYSDQQARETIAIYEQQFQLQREQMRTQMEATNYMPRNILRNVLYLMIVNLPNKEELAAAETAMVAEENQSGSREGSVTMVNVQ
ncbi:conserved hypothetical protein [Paecilomyces variotii No. 5]|uniref:Uncharacterized protein n=1 Tax=Byssochlamys spectabilis (strain No. 5 / NBRC 109023) TaxID=1356009 RepID=V5GFD3_BYSSN|nr:conserved hypothetical protein [Paecilomyces variotii No. 5]